MSRLLFLRDGCIICGATAKAKNSLSAEFVVDAINDHLEDLQCTRYNLRIWRLMSHVIEDFALLTARARKARLVLKPTNVGGRRLAPSAGAIAPKLGVMRKNYLSPEA